MDFLGSTTSLILLLLLILTVLLFTRQAGLEKVSIDLVICWVKMYSPDLSDLSDLFWQLFKVFPTLLLVSTTNRIPAWASKVFISQWSSFKNPVDVFSWWLNVNGLDVRKDQFCWYDHYDPAPYQPQEKIIFIQAPCQDKTTASWSKYNVNNKRNIFIQAPHLDL